MESASGHSHFSAAFSDIRAGVLSDVRIALDDNSALPTCLSVMDPAVCRTPSSASSLHYLQRLLVCFCSKSLVSFSFSRFSIPGSDPLFLLLRGPVPIVLCSN
jgi:hypothetical protein